MNFVNSNPELELATRLQTALRESFGVEFEHVDPLIRPSRFADFQSNVSLALAKRLGISPRAVAEKLLQTFDGESFVDQPEISGPGYINFKLLSSWLSAAVVERAQDSSFGIKQVDQRVVVDYSSPNVAKEMHVGHLRTTVVGDSLSRVLEATGASVIRQNHIGDWGTPFGMLIELLLEVGENSEEASMLQSNPNSFYQAARKRFDSDADFAENARKRVVLLQAGDQQTLELWEKLVSQSKLYFNALYSKLDVKLTDADLAGESTYNAQLASICEELVELGLAQESNGALVAFFEEHRNRDGSPAALVLRKSDGGYGYAATDLAALRYRAEVLQADRAFYVIGAPQALHLAMVKELAEKAGWLKSNFDFVHVAIGNVLGEDGKMLKTRSGEPVRLQMLLEEAVATAGKTLAEKRPDLSIERVSELAKPIGIGAVKYADLSVAHETEYTFNLERMTTLNGNTGPYLQYAGARIRSILRKAAASGLSIGDVNSLVLEATEERTLALKLLSFGPLVDSVAESAALHKLCAYLYELAQLFSSFYEVCPIMKAEPATRESRLALSASTLATLELGLKLLGITLPDEM